jgi:hypothetical protein
MGPHGIDQVLLQVLLLQVGHGKEAVVIAMRRFHAEHTLAPVEGIAEAPGQAVFHHPLRHAHLLEDLHGAAREDDGPAALGHLQLGFEQHAALAMARQLQRGGQSHRAGADDDDRMALCPRMLRRQPGLVHPVAVVDGMPRLGMGLVHGCLRLGPLQCRQHGSP